MNNEERKEKNCTDCLHCKVSAKSVEKCRLCFCSQELVKETYEEPYWLDKNVCNYFEDMSA
jgi:hypothetical protein